MPLLESKTHILLPVNPLFVMGTLAVSVLLNCCPFEGYPFVPDFVALTLAFWAVYQPRHVSMGSGFVLGLLMDVLHTTVLGQYALAYVLMTYVCNTFSRRIEGFPLSLQIFHMFPIFIGMQCVVCLISLVMGAPFQGWLFFSSSITMALVWPLWNFILIAPQRRAVEIDETRPI